MKNLKLILIIGITLITLSACKKGGSTPAPVEPTPITPAAFAQTNFGNATTRDFIGQIIDVTNNPIPNVTIKIGSATVQTDANGIFVIKNANVYEQFAYITATKTGFINGSKAVVPTPGTNNIKIMLLPITVTATINTGATSNVSLPNGTKITFDGAFKTDAGVAYTGAVSVIVNHLDPTDANLNAKMPGMLFAQATNGDAKALETYGMVNVELKGSAGEKLQIVNPSQVEFPINASQQTNAPATIPLWHFDEVNGYWIEAGTATKTGNKYIGSVKHFSWWNCDFPFPSVTLSIKVVDGSGNPLNNISAILSTTNHTPASGFTNANGEISGLVPTNQPLTLKIYDNCGTVISSQNIGPFATNTTLPNIVVNFPAGQSAVISGTLKKCDNTNVTNGYVSINLNNKVYYAFVANGAFSLPTINCSGNNTFTVTGTDFDNSKNTGTLNFTLVSPITNVGSLLACNTSTESITYKIDNGAYKIVTTNLTGSVSGNSFFVTGYTPSLSDQINISGNSIIPGTYTSSTFQLVGPGLSGISGSTISQQNISYTLNSIGAIGQYIDVSFTGTYTENTMYMVGNQMMTSPIPHTITGTAHVIRDN